MRNGGNRGRRPSSLWFHRWLGILITPIAVVVGLSGSLLAFEHELIRSLYPSIVTVEGRGEIVAANRIVAAAEQIGPVRYFRYPDAPSEPVRVVVGGPDGSEAALLVHPYSGALIGREPGILFPILFDLHAYLMLGKTGHVIGGLVGIALALCAVLGIVVWWPHSGRWKSQLIPREWRRFPRAFINLHGVIGIYGALVLVICALTGTAIVFRSQLSSVAVGLGGVPFNVHFATSASNCSGNLDDMVAQTRELLPGGRLTYVTPPQSPGGVTRIRAIMPGEVHPNGRSFVVFDCHGQVVHREIAPDLPFINRVLDHLIYPLHTGFALGAPGRIAVFFAGLMPAILSVTGIAVWLRRRSRRKA